MTGALRGCWLVGGLLPCGTVSGAASALQPLSQGRVGSLRDAASPWAVEGVSQGRGSGRASGSGAWVPLEALSCKWLPAAHLTTGLSCLEPAFRASSGLPAPCLGMPPSVSLWSLAGVPWRRAWLQPGNHWPPSMALCPNDELIGEGRVRTSTSTRSRPRPLWAEKLRHRETKGGPAVGLSGVLWSSLSADSAVPGVPHPCSVGAGMGRAPLRVTWANLGSADGSIGPASKGPGAGGQQEGGLGVRCPPSWGGQPPLLVCVFDGPSDPHCTPLLGTQRGPTYVCTQGWGATHSSQGLHLPRVWS